MAATVNGIVAGYDGSPASRHWTGPSGRRGCAGGMMLGSVSLALLHYAPCPVAVIHEQETSGEASATAA
jgi:nucleotide-binding universal stress UspA family protein